MYVQLTTCFKVYKYLKEQEQPGKSSKKIK